MIELIYGTDTVKVREQALVRVRESALGDDVVTLMTDSFDVEKLKDMLGAVSLFGSTQVVLLDMLMSDAGVAEQVVPLLEQCKESQNTFVWVEGKLTATQLKKIIPFVQKSEQYDMSPQKEFSTFALTDALVARDKKTLWITLLEAWKTGVSNEEIIGVLFWQLKTARLVARTQSAEEAGVKPFVYGKTKNILRKYTQEEIETLSRSLLTIYHKGHGGEVDLDNALERWVLRV